MTKNRRSAKALSCNIVFRIQTTVSFVFVAELLLLSPGRSPARLRRFVRLRSSCFRRHSSLSGWSSGSWQSEPVPLGARELFYSPLLLLFPLQLIRSKGNGFHMIDGSIKRIRCKKYHKTITDCCIADAF